MRTGKHLSVSGFLVCVVALAAISLPANAQVTTAPSEWMWMGGSSATGSGDLGPPGVYGTLGPLISFW